MRVVCVCQWNVLPVSGVPRRQVTLGPDPTSGWGTNYFNIFEMSKLTVFARTLSPTEATFMLTTPPEGPHTFVLTPAPPNMQPNINYQDSYYTGIGSAIPWSITPGTSRTIKVSLPLPLESVLPVTLFISTIPPGCVTPTSLTWDAASANNWRIAQADQSFTFTLPLKNTSVQVVFSINSTISGQWFAAPLNFTVYARSMDLVQQALVTSATFNLSTFTTGFWRNPSYVALSNTTGYGVFDGAGLTGVSTGGPNVANLADGYRDAFMWPSSNDALDRFSACVPGRSNMPLSLNPPRAYSLATTYNPTSVSTGMGWSWSGWVRMVALPATYQQGIWSAATTPGVPTIQFQYVWAYVMFVGYMYQLNLQIGASAVLYPYTLPIGRWVHLAVTMVQTNISRTCV